MIKNYNKLQLFILFAITCALSIYSFYQAKTIKVLQNTLDHGKTLSFDYEDIKKEIQRLEHVKYGD